MFKRILVAVDGSPASNAALRSAVELARDQRASLSALYVVDDGSLPINFEGTIYPPTFIDAYFEATHKVGRKILDRAIASTGGSGVAIEPVLVRSHGHSVAHVIIEQRRKLKADIVVLGTHGRRGLARMLMGSDAEQVLRVATVPVLLVHSRAKNPSPRRVSAKRRGSAETRRSPSTGGDRRTSTPRSNELR